jgi:hypothetical protein
MSKNDITGDTIKTKVLSKSAQQAYEDSYDRVFGKKKAIGQVDSNDKCPVYPEPCFCTGACKPSVLFKEQDCC